MESLPDVTYQCTHYASVLCRSLNGVAGPALNFVRGTNDAPLVAGRAEMLLIRLLR